MDIDQHMKALEADFAKTYHETHGGDMTHFDALLGRVRPHLLDLAQAQARSDAEAEQISKLRRSQMTRAEKLSFIQTKGMEAFKKLPW